MRTGITVLAIVLSVVYEVSDGRTTYVALEHDEAIEHIESMMMAAVPHYSKLGGQAQYDDESWRIGQFSIRVRAALPGEREAIIAAREAAAEADADDCGAGDER